MSPQKHAFHGDIPSTYFFFGERVGVLSKGHTKANNISASNTSV